jgi:hypothetical protein
LRLLLLLSLRIFLKFPLQKGVLGLQELVVILGLVDRGQVQRFEQLLGVLLVDQVEAGKLGDRV